MNDHDAATAAPASGRRAVALDCAWCGVCFDNIVDLLSHVDEDHLDDAAA